MTLLIFSAFGPPALAGSEGGGKLVVSETKIEYGFLEEGPPVSREVTLGNMGDNEIVIKNVRSS